MRAANLWGCSGCLGGVNLELGIGSVGGRRHQFGGDDVIGEDGDELVFVLGLEELGHDVCREFGEGFVEGVEGGEGVGNGQGLREPGRFNGGNQVVENSGGRGERHKFV